MPYVILGGTLNAIEAGIDLREMGCELVFALPFTYFGEDACGSWQALPMENQARWLERINQILRRLELSELAPPLLAGKIKKALLSAALAMGAQVIYMTRLAGIRADGDKITAAALAGKAGLKLIECVGIIDGTVYREPSFHIMNERAYIPSGGRASILLEYQGVRDMGAEFLVGPLNNEHAFLPVEYIAPCPRTVGEAREELIARAHAQAKRAADMGILQNALPAYIEADIAKPPKHTYVNFMGAEQTRSALYSSKHTSYGETRIFGAETELSADIMVAGGGTAGAWAAISAARAGARVCLAELFPYLGGTRTIGGINTLYGGNRNALFESMWEKIQQENQSVGSPLGEVFLYHRLMREAGITLCAPCTIWASERADARIEYVRYIGEQGGALIRAEQFIDATGDADLAVFAGIDTSIGSAEHGYVQNYSQATRISGTEYDISVADQGVMRPDIPAEWSRALTENTLNAADYDIRDMLTVRESRRIKGKRTLTITDVARGRRPSDCIYSAYSDYDPHARCFSEVGLLGVLPEHARARWAHIPLGALIPEGVDNLLVAGKAISADQDAFNFVRMSADIMCMGHICGYLAAECARERKRADELDISELQAKLYSQGAITFMPRARDEYESSAAMLKARILLGHDDAFNDAALAMWNELHEMMKRSLKLGAESDRALACEALMLYEAGECAEYLLKKLAALLDEEQITGIRAPFPDNKRLGGTEGDADTYWHINRIIALMAMRAVEAAKPLILRALKQATELGADWKEMTNAYYRLRPDRHTPANYDRILCLAYAARRLPNTEYDEHIRRIIAMLKNTQDDNYQMKHLINELNRAIAHNP